MCKGARDTVGAPRVSVCVGGGGAGTLRSMVQWLGRWYASLDTEDEGFEW